MTKYINLSNPTQKKARETEFIHCLDGDLEKTEAVVSPSAYKNVAFIGHDSQYGDVFKCWDDNAEDFTLFFGTKGDEFDSESNVH